jgi:protein-L-isoaspartate O-methyltransferase
MAVERLAFRTALAGLLLLYALTPTGLMALQKDSKKAPRVYTNDDAPFNHSPRESPPDAPPVAKDKPSESAAPAEKQPTRLAPFVPTPMPVVEKMLEVAQVTSGDVVYDLGSGDGRIVIMAAQKHGARSVGVELDRGLAEESTEKVRDLKLDGLVTIIQGDLLKTNLQRATVVTVYLLLGANDQLRPILERDLKPGTRVVAHDMGIPGWRYAQQESVTVDGVLHSIYLYQVPGAFRQP